MHICSARTTFCRPLFKDALVGVFVKFTVQLPLLQLTYVKYMKVHDTKLQLQGFPIFRRGAK